MREQGVYVYTWHVDLVLLELRQPSEQLLSHLAAWC
jgi:hypothetical protein